MRSKRMTSSIDNQNDRPMLWYKAGVPAVLAALFFLGLLFTLPNHAISASKSDETKVTTRDEGHPVPTKGPLISELREDLHPDIPGPETVIRRYVDIMGNEVNEYFVNGALYQISVTPVNSPPYYLIDVSGNGLFEEMYQGHQPRLLLPQWVFFRF